MSSFLKGIAQGKDNFDAAGDEAVQNAKAIRAKREMISAAMGGTQRASTPETTTARPGSPKDRVSPGAKFGSRGKEQRIDVEGFRKPLGSFKKGGKVKKTGVYKLHAKERVLNAKQTKNLDGLAKGLSK